MRGVCWPETFLGFHPLVEVLIAYLRRFVSRRIDEGSSSHIRFFFVLLAIASISFAQAPPDALGTIQSSSTTCEGTISGGVCYALDITCPALPNYTAYVKILNPTAAVVGTAVFVTGGSGTDLLELLTDGPIVVEQLLNNGYRIAELTYGIPFNTKEQGWETNANGAGIRAAACRFATVQQWVHDNFLDANTPLCAAGNSAGAELIGQSLAHYGAGDILSFAELSSGPPYGQLQYACENTQPVMNSPCSGLSLGLDLQAATAKQFVDPAYPGNWCSSSHFNHSKLHDAQFLNDSVLAPDAVLSYPNTFVNFIFGDQDTTSAIRQGLLYEAAITSAHASACLPGVGHEVETYKAGAKRVASDMIAGCKLPAK